MAGREEEGGEGGGGRGGGRGSSKLVVQNHLRQLPLHVTLLLSIKSAASLARTHCQGSRRGRGREEQGGAVAVNLLFKII